MSVVRDDALSDEARDLKDQFLAIADLLTGVLGDVCPALGWGELPPPPLDPVTEARTDDALVSALAALAREVRLDVESALGEIDLKQTLRHPMISLLRSFL